MDRAAAGTRVAVWPLAPRVPLDDDNLLADLAAARPAEVHGWDSRRALVLDAIELADLASIVLGRPVTHRLVTVAGLVREPSVIICPLGTPFGELVRRAGGQCNSERVDG